MLQNLITRILIVVIIIGLALQGPAAGFAQAASGSSATSGVQVLETSADGLVVELGLPVLNLQMMNTAGSSCQAAVLPDWGTAGAPGQPALPIRGLLIGIPPGSAPTVSVENAAPVVTLAGIDLCPAAQPVVSASQPGEAQQLAETVAADPQAYAADSSYPGPLAEITPAGAIRSQQVARLALQPVQYNPARRSLSYATRLRVRVTFHAPAGLAPEAAVNEGRYESILSSSLLNYQQARPWRTAPASLAPAAAGDFYPGSTQPAVRIPVNQDGIYQVTYTALTDAGIPAATLDALDPHSLRLFQGTSELSISVSGEGDGIFNSSDAILFYGQKNRTKFTDTNTYFLTWGGPAGLRMTTSDGTPAAGSQPANYRRSQHFETDWSYSQTNASGPSLDHWYWLAAQSPTVKTSSFTVNLAHVTPQAASPAPLLPQATVRGLLKGYFATSQHHTRIYINDTLIKDEFWPSTAEYAFEAQVAQSVLKEGANVIKVERPDATGSNSDIVFINWFEVDYTADYAADPGGTAWFRANAAGTWNYQVSGFPASDLTVLDISDPLHPLRVTPVTVTGSAAPYTLSFEQTVSGARQYLASTGAGLLSPAGSGLLSPTAIAPAHPLDLHDVTRRIDYIIISHPDFLAAVQPLADYYNAHQIPTLLVSSQDVYDEFGGGVYSPDAIHDFLAYAYASWARPAPAFVLLVGDGNYDFKNIKGSNEPSFIPPFLRDVAPWGEEIPAENRYVMVSGNDILPDMALGRFVVKTTGEATTVVNKTLAYLQAPLADWNYKVGLVADKIDPLAGDFPAANDAILPFLPAKFSADKIYYTVTHATQAEARQAILDDFNQGRLVIHYSGHASPSRWGSDQLLQNTDIASLTNAAMLPFVMSITCRTGYYVMYGRPADDLAVSALSEILLRAPNGGAVAVWASSGLGLTSAQAVLNDGFWMAIFNHHTPQIGQAINQALYYHYVNAPGDLDLLDSYILFGDPAASLKLDPMMVYVPLVVK